MLPGNDTRFRVLLDEFYYFAVNNEIVEAEVLEIQRGCTSGNIPDNSTEKAKYLFDSEKERKDNLFSLTKQLIPKIKKKASVKTINRLLLSLVEEHDLIILNLANLYTSLVTIQVSRRLENAGNFYLNSLDGSGGKIDYLESTEASKKLLQVLNEEMSYLALVADNVGDKYIDKLNSIQEFLLEAYSNTKEMIEYAYEAGVLQELSNAIITEHFASFDVRLKSNSLPQETSILERHNIQQQFIADETSILIQKINNLKNQFKNKRTLHIIDSIISEINNVAKNYFKSTDTKTLYSDMTKILSDLAKNPDFKSNKFTIELTRIDLENRYNGS